VARKSKPSLGRAEAHLESEGGILKGNATAARPHTFWTIAWHGPVGIERSGQVYVSRAAAEAVAVSCGAAKVLDA
jgi:hypothetical protein